METTLKLYSLNFSNSRTYLMAGLFVIGNILLPQLVHMIPQGGLIWLPIYFFTLIGAYKYGWKVGLLTAVASPLVNSVMFGMPSVAVLPAILMKSILLALLAGYASWRWQRASLAILCGVILSYQVTGCLVEWMMSGEFVMAVQDFRIGVPGMLLQVLGGWLVINRMMNK